MPNNDISENYDDLKEIPVGKAENLTGKRFDHCIVLCRVQSPISETKWKCLCDCGNIFYAYANNLKNPKYSHSCGCFSNRGKSSKKGTRKIDITGQRFGRLTVLEEDGYAGRQIRWKCKCDCGNIISVASYDLRSGHTQSCGCIRSKGEEKINILLNKNNINYTVQKTFNNLISKNGVRLKFDFYINDSYLIEYDGDIHYDTEHSRGWFSDEYRSDLKDRDELKNKWCKENNIPLIRIPYWHYDDLCLEDLLLETTQFRVV